MNFIKREELPQILQNFLNDNSISQAELARTLNVPKQTINNWLKGRAMPSYERLIALMELIENGRGKISQ